MSQHPLHHCIDPLTTLIPLNKSINLQSAAINSTKHCNASRATIVIGLMVAKKILSKLAQKNFCPSIPFFLVGFFRGYKNSMI